MIPAQASGRWTGPRCWVTMSGMLRQRLRGPRATLLPLSEGTTIGTEASAGDCGAAEGLADALWGDIEHLYGTGLFPAIGLHVQVGGRPLVDRAIGLAQGFGLDGSDEAVPATPDSLWCLFSASKAVTAILVHLLDDRGLLHVDDPVVEYIPEFGANGKEWVTIRHLLSHRAGFPYGSTLQRPSVELLADREGMLEILYRAKLDSRAGLRPAYLPISGGFILAEVVRRVGGRDVRQLLADEIAGPLGLDSLQYGVPEDQLGRVALHAHTGPGPYFPFTAAAQKTFGLSFPEVTALSNEPAFLKSIVPAGNVMGTLRDIAGFFEMLRLGGTRDGVRVLEHRTVRRCINETSGFAPDRTLVIPLRYGLGMMLGRRIISPFGPNTTRAFGHIGYTNVLTWTDPSRALTVVYMPTGKPIIAEHLPGLWRLLTRLSRDIPTRT